MDWTSRIYEEDEIYRRYFSPGTVMKETALKNCSWEIMTTWI
jgi:hypothetical protein